MKLRNQHQHDDDEDKIDYVASVFTAGSFIVDSFVFSDNVDDNEDNNNAGKASQWRTKGDQPVRNRDKLLAKRVGWLSETKQSKC